ncbi:MAG: glycosyltransferase [Bdellovibrionaceae bacterium]|nr:glycosyltransferase [Pseudobdellovibrionaceae bacterium]|tara:strand:- start:1366 stop:2592 length:1227 start_codon:yes stop_codon:yes gene_type:complete
MIKSPVMLLIGYVWPEFTSSAAGIRDHNLIKLFLDEGYEVHCASTAKKNSFQSDLEKQNVKTHNIKMNDSSFDEWIKKINPEVVIFDRFVTEEKFGWRVHLNAPNAIRILDTQDLHFLRKKRQALITGEKESKTNLYREISSIYRSDLSLIISSYEYHLLINEYNIPKEHLHLIRFCYEIFVPEKKFEERKNFITIGNYRHPPNADGIKWLISEIWPEIKRQIPEAQLHCYGAYLPEDFKKKEDKKNGIFFKGWAKESINTLKDYRINLAALRFGAGIKGKISDGWVANTPCITTPIGAEGMIETEDLFPGEIAENSEQFAQYAISLYQDKKKYQIHQKRCKNTIDKYYRYNQSVSFFKKINDLICNIEKYRKNNIIGNILFFEQHRSTEYFSRWIELKEKQNIEQSS